MLLFLLVTFAFPYSSTAQDWRMTGNYSDPNKFIGTIDDEDLVFRTFNIERMRLTKTGQLGIGTTEPVSKLHVVGNFSLNGTLTFVNWIDPNITEDRIFLLNNTGTGSARTMSQFLSDVHGVDCYEIIQGGDYYPNWQSISGTSTIAGKLVTGYACPARVGIGSNNPITDLHVHGGAFVLQKIQIGDWISTNTRLRISALAESGIQIITSDVSATLVPLSIQQSETSIDIFRISSGGNIHVTCTDPSEMPFVIDIPVEGPILALSGDGHLFVGGLHVKEVGSFPDYVFEEGYQLRSLYDLEGYIIEHKHLPEIPDAEEVSENGMDVNALLLTLVKKVEELTLYTISQQKEIDALKVAATNSIPQH